MTPIRHPQRQAFARMFALQTVSGAEPQATEPIPGDPLARLLEGAAFRRAFHRQASRRLRTDEPLTLALLGIDDFPAIERLYGPGVADQVLMATSRRLQDVFRASDLLARWGPQVFAVLMPGTSLPGGLRAVEKALVSVYGAAVSTGADQQLELSISAGALPVTSAMPFLEALEQVEGLLVLAQQHGRARLRWSEGEIAVNPRRVVAITHDRGTPGRLDRAPGYFSVEILEAGPHAVAVVERAAPGLILLDVDSSGDAGWELLKGLRRSLRLQGVPILVLSSRRDDLVRSFAAGADDFVLRSAANEELQARADRLICRRVDVLVTRLA